jgi:exosortase
MSARESFLAAWRRQPGWARLEVLLLALGAASLTLLLWPTWVHNPDLAHGFFLPIVFVILLGESRAVGPHRYLTEGRFATTLIASTAAGGVMALALGGLYAAVLDWNHALVQYLLSAALALLLFAGLLVFAGEPRRLVPLNWSSLVAVALWLLAAPIPPGSYTRLTIALQLRVSQGVLLALHWLGIPAVRTGNILQLATTQVGVEEACSGVRSLLSCVFAALFFSATLVRRPRARLLIIALSVPLALFMNFVRSLILTLMANADIAIGGFWHDATGYSVLIVTGILLGALALLLERGNGRAYRETAPATTPPSPRPAGPWLLGVSLALATALLIFCAVNTRSAPAPIRPGPNLEALLPARPPGWTVVSDPDLNRYASILRSSSLAQRGYIQGSGPDPLEITIYLAYWHPGQAPVSLVASHTPDACWPGAGWSPVPGGPARLELPLAGGRLPSAEQRAFRNGAWTENVWFWHLYGGRPIVYRDPYSLGALGRIALKYGFLHNGDQLFVRVSSNRSWAQIAAEPMIQQCFASLAPLGLVAVR